MCFDGWEVDDVFADKPLGDHEPFWVYLVEAEELIGQVADGVSHIDPLFVTLVEVDIAEPMGLNDVNLFIFAFAQMSVNDDGPVMAGMDFGRVIAVPFEAADNAFHLPRRGGTAGVEKMPTDIHLEGGIGLAGDDVLVSGEIHQTMVIFQDGCRGRSKNGHFGFTHAWDRTEPEPL